MPKELLLFGALALVIAGSIMFGWLLNEWQRRPRYRRNRR